MSGVKGQGYKGYDWFMASFVKAESGCWEWTASTSTEGYGRIGYDYAHRVSHQWFKGDIPQGYEIDHLCGNRLCVNPDHLEAVTPAENMRRSSAPSAVAVRTNRCQRGHEFTPENTYMRRNGHRICRECQKLRDRLRVPRRRAVAA